MGSVKASITGRGFRKPALRPKQVAVLSSVQNPTAMTAASPLLETIRARIARAAQASGREPADVTLVAVSKQQPWDQIAPVLSGGQSMFGENRVQEASERWAGKTTGIELRLIGPLQTNKVADALRLFPVIETLDRANLAEVLAREIQKQGKATRLYVQINTGEEPQKSGVAPRDADAFIDQCRRALGLPIEGLMCIPPVDQPGGPHFALLAKIARRNGLDCLSMGMSQDFETAIAFGATSVRVGSALFGGRTLKQ